MSSPGAPASGGSPDVLATSAAGPAVMRGGALRIAGYVAGVLMSAVSAALLFRHLGHVYVGFYVLAQSLIAIVDALADLGLTAIGIRELSLRQGADRAVIVRNLMGLRIVGTVVGVLIAAGFGVVVGYRQIVVEGVLVAGVGLLLQCMQASLSISLLSRLRLGWVTVIELMRQLILMMLVILLVVLGAGLLPFLAVTAPAAGAVLVATAVLVRGDVPLRPSFDRHEWHRLILLVLPYSAAVAASTLYFRLGVIVVSLLDSSQLGYFSASFRVVEALIAIPALAVQVVLPVFTRSARDDRDRLGYGVNRVFHVNVLIGVWVALCFAIGAHLAIRILGNATFAPAAPILAIQGVAVGANFVSALWGAVLLSLGRYRTVVTFNVVVLAIGLVAISGMVKLDGGKGAAIAISAIEVGAAIAGGVVLARADRRLAVSLRLLPRLVPAAGLAALAVLIPTTALVRLIVASVIYAIALTALGLVPEEVGQELRRWRRRNETQVL